MIRVDARHVALALGWIAAYVAAGAFAVHNIVHPDEVAAELDDLVRGVVRRARLLVSHGPILTPEQGLADVRIGLLLCYGSPALVRVAELADALA